MVIAVLLRLDDIYFTSKLTASGGNYALSRITMFLGVLVPGGKH